MFRPIKWSLSGPSQTDTESQKAVNRVHGAHYYFDILPYFTTPYFYVFYSPPYLIFLLFILLHYQICPLVNTNGIPYVCAAFCDSVSLCDGPDDDHLIGRNMLSIWYFYGNK